MEFTAGGTLSFAPTVGDAISRDYPKENGGSGGARTRNLALLEKLQEALLQRCYWLILILDQNNCSGQFRIYPHPSEAKKS
jgi:hypothetical protein